MSFNINGKHVIVLGDKTTHGGQVITAADTFSHLGIPIARVGDKVSCPTCKGVYEIIEGAESSFDHGKPIAVHDCLTSCGAKLIATSRNEINEDTSVHAESTTTDGVTVTINIESPPNTFVDVSPAGIMDTATSNVNHYINICRLCKKDIDGPSPLEDASFNKFRVGQENFIICDRNFVRHLRRIIDAGQCDVDILWQMLCQWYIAHKNEWDAKDSFHEIVSAMHSVLGKNPNTLKGEGQGDNKRWFCVQKSLGNVRFGGRGELYYPSYDKFQHFIGGAWIGYKYLANAIGTGIEFADAAIRLYKEIFSTPEPHQIGWDYHDYEWTWAGGAFASKVDSLSQQETSNILQKFSDGRIVFSEVYTSISRNKDGDHAYANNPNIDHAESNIPNPGEHLFIATMINVNIAKMEKYIEYEAKN